MASNEVISIERNERKKRYVLTRPRYDSSIGKSNPKPDKRKDFELASKLVQLSQLNKSSQRNYSREVKQVKLKINHRSNKICHSYSFPTVADTQRIELEGLQTKVYDRHRVSWLSLTQKEILDNEASDETVYGCTANKLF